jgi:hypothetical protein
MSYCLSNISRQVLRTTIGLLKLNFFALTLNSLNSYPFLPAKSALR